jgi:ABC-type transport system substrate-binding protein
MGDEHNSMDDHGIDRDTMDRRTFGAKSAAMLAGVWAAKAGGLDLISPRSAGPRRVLKGVLTCADYAPLSTLDPAKCNLGEEFRCARNCFDTLVRYNSRYRIAPMLATSWKTNHDNTVWQFNLRSGVKFHDGTPFNSTAVKRNFEYYAANAGGLQQLLLPKIAHIDDSHPNVVRIEFDHPAADLLRNSTIVYMISPAVLAHGAAAVARNPIGSGPFSLAAQSDTGYTLKAWPHYWGAGPYLKEVQFDVVSETSVAAEDLQAGDLNMVLGQPPLLLDQLESLNKFTVQKVPSIATAAIFYSCSTPPSNNLTLRRAITYGINVKAIANASFAKGGVTIANSVVAPLVKGFALPKTPYRYDPVYAKKLLKEAGYPHGISLTLNAVTSVFEPALVGQVIASQLSQIGVQLHVNVQDVATWIKNQYGPHPAPMGMASYADVTGTSLFLGSGLLLSTTHYPGGPLVGLLKRYAASPNGPARDRLLAQAIEIFGVGGQCLELPLLHQPVNAVFDRNINGFFTPPDQATEYYGGVSMS